MNRFVFVCHPYGDDPTGNAAAIRSICAEVTASGDIPIAPALYFPQWLDESVAADREAGLEMSCAMVLLCREVRVYGPPSGGMRLEIETARAHSVPVAFMDAGEWP